MAHVSEQTQDQALVEGLLAQEERAVAALLDRYWAPAYRVALGICADAAAAEDVAQEGLVRAVQGIEGFQPGAPLRPWILRIVANLARNELRSGARRDARERAVARPERDRARGPAAEAALREETRYVRALLAQLPPQLRETLSLRYLDELSLNEVAGALGCPTGTVSSRIRRGLARLREGLEQAAEAGTAIPKPVAGLGALGALTLLRGVVAPPAASAGQVLSAAAQLPPLPALLAAPEAAAGAAGLAAAAAGAPAPPAPNEVLSAAREAARGLTESAPHAGASLAPLAIVILALGLGGGAGGLLLSDPSPTPTRAADARPAASSLAPSPAPAALARAYRGRIVSPQALRDGDRVTATAELSWDPGLDPRLDLGYSGEDLRLSAELRELDGGALALSVGRPSAEAGAIRWPLELSARAPGSALLSVSVRRGEALVFHQELPLTVQGRQRAVRLVHNLTLSGPEGEATLSLDPRAARLEAPRRLALRVIPGFAAEATLSLRGLARQPTGCFEQTTAATYPSAMVLALATQSRASRETVEEARVFALQGSERLRRFQGPRGFSLHPHEPADPWLTALGLRQLSVLSGVIQVEPGRLQEAARALLAWQEPAGSFPQGPFVRRRAASATLAVTATACEALAVYLETPRRQATPPTEELQAALERGLAWLTANLERARGPAERAYVARAFLRGGRPELAQRLAEGFLKSVQRPAPGLAFWEGEGSLTGGSAHSADVEATALVVQVLSGLGEREPVGPALAWLATRRRERGFGGTQATIQALEAFRSGGLGPAEGQVQVRIGREALPPLEVGEDLVEQVLGEGVAEQGRLFALAQTEGLELRFRGQGTLQLQLVAEGEVPWDTPWGRGGQARAQGAEQLLYEVTRPLQGRVGVVQRWAIQVRNSGRAWSTSPMVQLSLPPGFALPEPEGARELEDQVQSGRLRAWELRGGRDLVLYLPDLAPGQQTKVWAQLVPQVAGEFAGGALEVYPYYDTSGLLASSLPRTRIAPALVVAEPEAEPTLASPAQEVSAPEEPAPEEPPPSESPEPAESAALRIAWDERSLGPLDLDALDLSWGDGPGERLLARALCAYPGVGAQLQETPGASAQVILARRSWSDERPLGVDDYLAGFEANAKRRAGGELPLLTPEVWALFERAARPGAGAGRALTWTLPRELLPLLESAPFAAQRGAPPRGQARAYGGPYRPVRAKKGVLRLVPRISGRVVEVVPLKRVRPRDFERFDLVWAQRAPRDDALIGDGARDLARSVIPAAERSFWITLVPNSKSEAPRGDLSLELKVAPPELAGLPLAARQDRVELVLPRRGTLACYQKALLPYAKHLASRVSRQGFRLEVEVDLAASRRADLLLVATPLAGGVPLARYDSLLLPGRLDPGATLDHNGFLIWPPRVQAPRSRRGRETPVLRRQ